MVQRIDMDQKYKEKASVFAVFYSLALDLFIGVSNRCQKVGGREVGGGEWLDRMEQKRFAEEQLSHVYMILH